MKTLKTLIADDSVLIRQRLVAMLSEIDAVKVVGEASDGLKAIDAVSRLNPDLVILDIQMPESNGFEVLQKIKQDKPSCVVMMLTKYNYAQYRDKCMKLGADYFFDKSMELDEMLATVEKLGKESS